MQNYANSWQFWALLAAVFAALTAIFAKIGVEGVNSNFATFLRTLVVVAAFVPLLWVTGEYESLSALSGRTALFLVLSGLATGASWLCYFRALQMGQASQVAPIDKLSVVFVAIIGATFLGERLSATGWTGIVLIAGGAILVAMG
jgi:transporter family protein